MYIISKIQVQRSNELLLLLEASNKRRSSICGEFHAIMMASLFYLPSHNHDRVRHQIFGGSHSFSSTLYNLNFTFFGFQFPLFFCFFASEK